MWIGHQGGSPPTLSNSLSLGRTGGAHVRTYHDSSWPRGPDEEVIKEMVPRWQLRYDAPETPSKSQG